MASIVQQKWQFAQRLERELHARLKERDTLFEDVQDFIHNFRIACEDIIFLDFDYAAGQRVDLHLWNTVSSINNRYRKILARYKTEERKKHVERRKWEQRYVDFLKTSQYFYKGYIQRLASHFDGLVELRKIAHRLNLNTLSADDRVRVSEKTKHLILLSCHATLLRLGDLSRYRNDIRTKDRSWDTAMSYYGLANDLYPNSGNAFNQMAVISLAEGHHLNAIYHLYRALAIDEPHPAAESNLELEFKKIIKEWENGNRRSVSSGTTTAAGAGGPLISWFVRLHAKLYKGEEFLEHDELENEVFSQMTVLLKEQSLEGVLDKFVLVNIAAEYFAAERLQNLSTGSFPSEENFRSYYSFLRLNVRMLFMLLQLLQPELAGPRDDDDAPDVTGRNRENNTECITVVIRRILPALRQYSTWLVSRAEIISAQNDPTSLNVHIKEMWSMYCSSMSLLVVTFPPQDLENVEYLLEEDMATVGLKPFRDSELCRLYINNEGYPKPRSTDPDIQRSHPNLEMRARVKDLLGDAMVLAHTTNKDGKKIAPIHLVGLEFHFLEEGLPMSPADGLSADLTIPSPQNQLNTDVTDLKCSSDDLNEEAPPSPSVAPSDSHQSMSTDMYRMVDDLVTPSAGQKSKNIHGSYETSYGMHSSTAAEVFRPSNFSTFQTSRQNTSHTLFPILPGISKSPFSPQPGELTSSSPDQPETARRLSTVQLPSNENQKGVPNPLNQSTNYSQDHRLSWDSNLPLSNPLPAHTVHQGVTQQLQGSPSQQYEQLSTPVFSHSSSVYSGSFLGRLDPRRPFGDLSHNTGASRLETSEFDRDTLLQSSIWNTDQRAWTGSVHTPPNGQGQG